MKKESLSFEIPFVAHIIVLSHVKAIKNNERKSKTNSKLFEIKYENQ